MDLWSGPACGTRIADLLQSVIGHEPIDPAFSERNLRECLIIRYFVGPSLATRRIIKSLSPYAACRKQQPYIEKMYCADLLDTFLEDQEY